MIFFIAAQVKRNFHEIKHKQKEVQNYKAKLKLR